MIQANELRIDNWVKFGCEYLQVFSIVNLSTANNKRIELELDCQSLDKHVKGVDIRRIEPIRLTEDILLKCKNIETKIGYYGKYYYINPFILLRFYFDKSGKLIVCKKEDNKVVWICELEYLHAFQNLYFALTGTDLEVNL